MADSKAKGREKRLFVSRYGVEEEEEEEDLVKSPSS